jgi:predicted transcriptional regulator
MAIPEISKRQELVTQSNNLADLPLKRPEQTGQGEEIHTHTKVNLCQVKEIHDKWPENEFGINFKQALFIAINNPKRSNNVSSPKVFLKIKETVSGICESLNKSPQVMSTYNWVTDYNYDILGHADQPSSCLKHNMLKQISSGFSGPNKTEQRSLIAATIFSKNLNAESAKALISYLEQIDEKSDLSILQSSINSFFLKNTIDTKRDARAFRPKLSPTIEKLPEPTLDKIEDRAYQMCKSISNFLHLYENSEFPKKNIGAIKAIKYVHPKYKNLICAPQNVSRNDFIKFKEMVSRMLTKAGVQKVEDIDNDIVVFMTRINPNLVPLIRQNPLKGFIALNTAVTIVSGFRDKENYSIQKLMFEWFKDQPSAQEHAPEMIKECIDNAILTPETDDNAQRGLINITFTEYCRLNKIPIEKNDFTRLNEKLALDRQKENITHQVANTKQNPTSLVTS